MAVYEPGDLIVECEPLVHAVGAAEKGKRCDYCLECSDDLKRCAKCKRMFYCGMECAAKDWEAGHKYKECLVFVKLNAFGMSFNQLPQYQSNFSFLRLVLKMKHDKKLATKKVTLFDGKTVSFNDLPSHFNSSGQKDESCRRMSFWIAFALKLVDMEVTMSEIRETYCRYITNCVAISDSNFPFESNIGVGVYLEASSFEHSCLPNSQFLNNLRKLEVRAMSKVDVGSGQRPTVYFFNVALPTELRVNYLAYRFYAVCHCDRCTVNDSFDYERYSKLEKQLVSKKATGPKFLILQNQLIAMEKQIYGENSLLNTIRLFKIFEYASRKELRERVEYEKNFSRALVMTHGIGRAVQIKKVIKADFAQRFRVVPDEIVKMPARRSLSSETSDN